MNTENQVSLQAVLKEKTIKARYSLLSNYLKTNGIGLLPPSEVKHFKTFFYKYYVPDDGDEKFSLDEIDGVAIKHEAFGTKCFSALVNGELHPCSIKRLSGGGVITDKTKLRRALRHGINEQINEFRNTNQLNTRAKCPIMNINLGIDAQIDHEIPFHIIADEWLIQTPSPSYEFKKSEGSYVLNDPYLESWREFHKSKAKLRWLSREGNKIAHKLFDNKIEL